MHVERLVHVQGSTLDEKKKLDSSSTLFRLVAAPVPLYLLCLTSGELALELVNYHVLSSVKPETYHNTP